MNQVHNNVVEPNIRDRIILIIDDDPNNLAIVSDYLEEASFKTLVAEDGEIGLKRADYARPDLILLDVLMPGIDGFETCRRLKGMESTMHIPVIFMTALAETEHKVRGFEAGAVDYITKPFQREEVLARVVTHLRIDELTRRLKEANDALERRVKERTAELTRANEELQAEIGERKRTEELLRKANQAYKALSRCNQALLHASEESELLAEVCRIIVKDCGYHLVWIGFAEHDQAKTVRPVAQSGYEEGYFSSTRITWADTELGHGPSGTAIRTKKPVINRDVLRNPDFTPWRAEAIKHGFASTASFPMLTTEGEVIGSLNVYAAQPDAFSAEEIDLLAELTGDLTFGIVGLRIRAERKQAEEAVKESRERFRNLVETTSDWVWEIDENSVYTYASPKARDILGYEPEEVLGKTPLDLMPSDEAQRVAGIFKDITASRKPFSLLENINLHRKGHQVILETSGVPLFDTKGNFRGYRGIDRDITERKRAEEMIKYQAYHDLLTGLPNRALFMDRLTFEIPQMQRTKKKLAVLLFDIDHFKNINDSLGHTVGDTLIREIADRLKTCCLRETDAIARIGNDEFTLLLPLISRPEEASRIVEKIIADFKTPFVINKHELHVTFSIGITIYPDDSMDAKTLFKNADIAVHYAKDQGGNNYQFFNSDINVRTIERIILENNLRKAVIHDQLIVHYQPQRDLQTGKITGAEALVRWNHPELGLIKPMQFIPLAEEIGLIIDIDQWVLRRACEQLKAWDAAGYRHLHVTTNLSSRQFQQPDLAKIISNVLTETELDPKRLGIEITETLAMQDTELTVKNVNQLNEMGVRFLIDDFGTGYSSLSYLKKLPIHKLKIDKSFITSLVSDSDYQAIVDAIIAMAHILKLRVIAEGVETEDQMAFLNSRNCDEMQGYLFSKPVPANHFEELLGTPV